MTTINLAIATIGILMVLVLLPKRRRVSTTLRDEILLGGEGASSGHTRTGKDPLRVVLLIAVLSNLMATGIVAVVAVFPSTTPWRLVDAHGHTVLASIECDLFERQTEKCNPSLLVSEPPQEQVVPVLSRRANPAPSKDSKTGKQNGNSNPFRNKVQPLPIVAPLPQIILPPQYDQSSGAQSDEMLSYEYGIDRFGEESELEELEERTAEVALGE